MAENPEIPLRPAMVAPTSPPTVHGSVFAISSSPGEFGLVFGTARQVIDQKTGAPGSVPGVEWFVAVAMSATTAEQLYAALGQTLEDYRKAYGPIPSDPRFVLDTKKAGAQ